MEFGLNGIKFTIGTRLCESTKRSNLGKNDLLGSLRADKICLAAGWWSNASNVGGHLNGRHGGVWITRYSIIRQSVIPTTESAEKFYAKIFDTRM